MKVKFVQYCLLSYFLPSKVKKRPIILIFLLYNGIYKQLINVFFFSLVIFCDFLRISVILMVLPNRMNLMRPKQF